MVHASHAINRMHENIWTQWSSSSKNWDKEVTIGEQNKEKKYVYAQFSLKINKCYNDSKCSDSSSAFQPSAQTCTHKPVPANKSHNTKHESGLMEQSLFQ